MSAWPSLQHWQPEMRALSPSHLPNASIHRSTSWHMWFLGWHCPTDPISSGCSQGARPTPRLHPSLIKQSHLPTLSPSRAPVRGWQGRQTGAPHTNAGCLACLPRMRAADRRGSPPAPQNMVSCAAEWSPACRWPSRTQPSRPREWDRNISPEFPNMSPDFAIWCFRSGMVCYLGLFLS